MTEKRYLLSICIPTFNRVVPLERLMESIVHQDAFCSDVCVVVTDGNSSDGTSEMMAEYVEKHKNIIFHKSPVNTGMRKALLEATESSLGKYTWLVGSDDEIAPGAIATMLESIKQSDVPALILGNLHPYSTEEEKLSYSSPSGFTEFENFHDFANFIGSDKYDKKRYGFEQHFTFMSVFCFDSDYFSKSLRKVVSDRGIDYLNENYFNFIYVVFSGLQNKRILLLKGDTILLDGHNNIAWRPNMKIPKDLSDLFEMINSTYDVPNTFKLFEKIMNDYVYSIMKKARFTAPLALFLKKMRLYGIAHSSWHFILRLFFK